MDLKEGASVVSARGEQVGKINRFVLHPGINEVTHIVVQKGWLLPEDKLIPAHWLKSVEEAQVQLSVPSQLRDRLPDYLP